ncbi:MAG: hypothetical protein RI637_04705, partial [Acidimicrobiia bacterium]|nr:hypothetical protein [Acidimicrobiia bacterium]
IGRTAIVLMVEGNGVTQDLSVRFIERTVQVVSRQYDTVLAVLSQEGVWSRYDQQGANRDRLIGSDLNASKRIVFALGWYAAAIRASRRDERKHRQQQGYSPQL